MSNPQQQQQASGCFKYGAWIAFGIIMFISMIFIFALASGDSTSNEPASVKLSKDHSVEVTLETIHLGTYDVLKTRRSVYVKGQKVKEFISIDTIPALGDTLIKSDDNTWSGSIAQKKDYQIFVTIK